MLLSTLCREVLIHSRECQASGGQGSPGWLNAAAFLIVGRAAVALLALALLGAAGYLGAGGVARRVSAAMEAHRERHRGGPREVRRVCLPAASVPGLRRSESADACAGCRYCQDTTSLLWLEEEAGCSTSSFLDEYPELETSHDVPAQALLGPAPGVAPPSAGPASEAADSETPPCPREGAASTDPLADLDPFK